MVRGALIGLHGVPNYSSWQFEPPLWIVSVYVTYFKAQHFSLSLHGCVNLTLAPHPPHLHQPTPPFSHQPTPYRLNL